MRLLPAEQSRHLVREPAAGQSISRILQSLTVAHTWHDHRARQTSGHVWPGRFQSPVAATGEHLLTVCRCVESNPLRAGLVARAEHGRWSGLWHRAKNLFSPPLHAWPVAMPDGWLEHVNRPGTAAEREA